MYYFSSLLKKSFLKILHCRSTRRNAEMYPVRRLNHQSFSTFSMLLLKLLQLFVHSALHISRQSRAIRAQIIEIDDLESDYSTRFMNVARLYRGKPEDVLSRLKTSSVLVIGLGGVGSWVVEALARSGINSLVLIDLDDICVSNVNRQLPAMTSTIGKFKGQVLLDRVLDINPSANVTFIPTFLRPDNLQEVFSSISRIDYVIDCADGVTDKAAIVDYCVQHGLPIAVSGGAGGIIDPTLIRITDMARSVGDTLIMRVRKKLRQHYGYPEGKQTNSQGLKIDKKWNILVAHSLPTGAVRRSETTGEGSRKCDAVYGNTCFSTGTIGFALASVAVNAIASGDIQRPKRLGRNPKGTALKPMEASTEGKHAVVDLGDAAPVVSSGATSACGCSSSAETEGGVPSARTAALPYSSVAEMDGVLASRVVEYFDSHCHLQLHPAFTGEVESIAGVLANAARSGVTHMSVCGTCPGDDWRHVEALYARYSSVVIPHFGLHPWWIARYKASLGSSEDTWEAQLSQLLEKYPFAGVGECGLDKAVKREVQDDLQEQIVLRHILIAHKYARPVTLHCVGMWGTLLEIITSNAAAGINPSAYILHSCNSMPVEMVDAFDSLGNVYFSLSSGRYDNPKFTRLVKKIPLDKLLLETDSPDQLPVILRSPSGVVPNEPGNMRYDCLMLSSLLGSREYPDLAKVSRENCFRAYNVVPR